MANENSPTYTVESQMETVGVGKDGKAAEGVKITFVTRSGVRFSVFVPKSEYTLANVKAAITAAASEVEAVSALSG